MCRGALFMKIALIILIYDILFTDIFLLFFFLIHPTFLSTIPIVTAENPCDVRDNYKMYV